MSTPSSDDEIIERVRELHRRSYIPAAYLLILAFPVVADLFHIPVSHALLWPITFAVFAAVICLRTLVVSRKPNPAAGVDPLLFRQGLVELGGFRRRRLIIWSSLAFALVLWSVPYAASPLKGIMFAVLAGIVFGAGTAAFLLNIRISLPTKATVFRDHELAASLRNQATKWSGLIVLVVAVVGLPAIMLRQEAAPPVLSVLLWTACEAPLLVFAWLEYRIERHA
jgi:hypothetical protein